MTNSDSDNVVLLNATNSVATRVRYTKLFEKCQTITTKHLQASLLNMFDNADDTLFSMAEKADHTTDQTYFFDSMRVVRLHRESIESKFKHLIQQQFTTRSKHISPVEESSLETMNFSDLSLVEEADLEETIAIKNIVTKIKNKYTQELGAINKRMAHILSYEVLTDDDNPAGPVKICEAFVHAVKDLDIDLKISLIILKLFEKELLVGVASLYKELNEFFITENVLPKLKLAISKKEQTARSDSAAEPDALADYNGHSHANTSHLQQGRPSGSNYSQQDTSINHLHALLHPNQNIPSQTGISGYATQSPNSVHPTNGMFASAAQPGTAGGTGSTNGIDSGDSQVQQPGSGEFNATHFISALSSIQTNGPTYNPDNLAPLSPSDITQHVIQQIQKQHQGFDASQLNPLDKDVIDVVSMLFEYILDDKNIIASAKALIAKLQIPMIKAAIIDKEFFATNGHPARALLNSLAKAALIIGDNESDETQSLLNKIQQIVETIISDFQDDISIFQLLLTEFENYMEEHEQEVHVAHEGITQKGKFKEDYALATQWVESTLTSILQEKVLPEPVVALLKGPWKKVMLHTFLNSGQDSNTWKNQTRFIDILIWSVQPKNVKVDRSMLGNIIHQLLTTLRNGLTTIGATEADIQSVLNTLEPYHVASVKGELYHTHTEKPEHATSDESNLDEYNIEVSEVKNVEFDKLCEDTGEFDLDTINETIRQLEQELDSLDDLEESMETFQNNYADKLDHDMETQDKVLMENIVLSDYGTQEPDAEQVEDEYLELARHLEQGKWVEFTNDEGKQVRAKLAWKSDLLGEFTFTDWRFNVVADKSLNGFATELRRGSAMILDDVPILDRALSAVMDTLSLQKQA